MAILYYFTVLFSEIAILYNEDNKRRQLERAARSGRGKESDASPGAKKSARDASGGRLVDEASGEINTGRLETATNPLFLSGGTAGAVAAPGAASLGGDGSGADGIMTQRAPPPPELWAIIQGEWASQKAAMGQLRAQLADARKASQQASAAAGGAEDEAGASPTPKSAAKKAFAPAVAGGVTSSARKLLKKKSEI